MGLIDGLLRRDYAERNPLDFEFVHCEASGVLPRIGDGRMGECCKCGTLLPLVDTGLLFLSDSTPAMVVADHEYPVRIGGQFS